MRIALFFFSLYAAVSFSQDSCVSILDSVISPKDKKIGKENKRQGKKKRTKTFLKTVVETLEQAKKLQFSEKNIAELEKVLNSMETLPAKKEVFSYLSYMESLKEKEVLPAVLQFPQTQKEIPEGKYAKTFVKLQKKIKEKESAYYQKAFKKVQKDNPELTEKRIRLRALRKTRMFVKDYERVSYGCSSNRWTPERKAAANLYKNFTIAVGLTTGIASYSWIHRDKEIDGHWFGRLGYELSWGIIGAWLNAKVLSNPHSSISKKAIQSYFLGRGVGFADIGLYSFLFSPNEKKVEERLHKIVNDPEREKIILELRKFLENESFYHRLKSEMANLASKAGISIAAIPEFNIPGVDFSKLTEEDLKREDVKEALMALALISLYQENKGDGIVTGDHSLDRYAFLTAYGLVPNLPKDILIGLYIYNTLCMGQLDIRSAVQKAVAVYAINKVIFDPFYYYQRKEAIGM